MDAAGIAWGFARKTREFAACAVQGRGMTFFHGCTALITGASSGFGAEFARQLAPFARCLVLSARTRPALEALAAELVRPGLDVRIVLADLGDSSQVDALIAAAAGVDFLINNAGLGDHGLFEKSEWSRVQAMLDVNVTALTRFAPRLHDRRSTRP